jgi:hypothetical protein
MISLIYLFKKPCHERIQYHWQAGTVIDGEYITQNIAASGKNQRKSLRDS